MKKHFIALSAIAAIAPTIASAVDIEGYVGGSLGISDYDSDRMEEYSPQSRVSTGISDMSPEHNGVNAKLFGGAKIGNYLAIEGFYTGLGEVDRFNTNFPHYFEAATSISGWGASAIGIIPLTPQFSVFGKAGLFSWEQEVEIDTQYLGDVTERTEEYDGTDPVFGIGASYRVNSVSFRGEFERYTAEDDTVDVISVGAAYHF